MHTFTPSTQEEGRCLGIWGQPCLDHTVRPRLQRKGSRGGTVLDNDQVSLQFTDEQARYLRSFQSQQLHSNNHTVHSAATSLYIVFQGYWDMNLRCLHRSMRQEDHQKFQATIFYSILKINKKNFRKYFQNKQTSTNPIYFILTTLKKKFRVTTIHTQEPIQKSYILSLVLRAKQTLKLMFQKWLQKEEADCSSLQRVPCFLTAQVPLQHSQWMTSINWKQRRAGKIAQQKQNRHQAWWLSSSRGTPMLEGDNWDALASSHKPWPVCPTHIYTQIKYVTIKFSKRVHRSLSSIVDANF